MPKIALITDTDASLPLDLAAQHNIRLVPITILFGNQAFDTEIDITEAEVFERIDREGVLPTTAAPSPGKFAEAYQAALDEGAEHVICFTVSGEISGTYGSAVAASEMESFQGKDITVIDTQSLSMGQGFAVLAAAEAVEAGASKEEVIAIAQDVVQRVGFFAALSTLKYLALSGRVGHLAAGMASILNIKPILTIQNGKLEMLEKVRTRKKAWNRTLELASQALNGKSIERMAIVHSNALNDARQFEALALDTLDCPKKILICNLTAGLSIHSGAGLVGLGFVIAKS